MGARSAKKLRSAIRQTLAENQKLILVNANGLRERAIRGCRRAIDDFGVESLLAGAFMTAYAGGALRIIGTSDGVKAALERDGAIRKKRGIIVIEDRHKLERRACECYADIQRHYRRLLPGVLAGPS